MKKFKNKPAGIINSSDLKTGKGKLLYWIFFTLLILASLISVLPTIWVILTSFKDTQEIYSGMSFFPSHISFALVQTKIIEAWKIMDFGKQTLNTVVLALGSVVFSLALCGLGGYVISRLKPKGAKLVFTLIVWTMMMPSQIRIVPTYMSYLSFPFIADFPWEVSLLNTYWPMWLGAAANCFNLMLFKNHFDSIPISYVEAAKLDGCSDIRIFFNIMVPLSAPIMIYVAIMTSRSAFSEFFTPYLVLTDKNLTTLPQKIFMLKKEPNLKMNTYLLCLVMASIPPFIIFVIFQKYIVGGVNVGGVKG